MTVPVVGQEARNELVRLSWYAEGCFWSTAVTEAAALSPLPTDEFEATFAELGEARRAHDTARVEAALDALLTDPRETATSSPRRLPPASEVTEGGTPRC